ncbi:MAG TPA: branched-chain amino acid ABC transporter permease [Actinomycetota bacterium]|nr:branched-chain amino acid ABC transporter permease [Actinomycetota bacterium]
MFSSLVIGLIVGAGYGLMALGIVIVYKASRQFNFAQGEFGTVATFAAWAVLERGHGWLLAALAGVIVGVLFGLGTEFLVVRPLSGGPPVTLLVATAGVALFSIAVQIILGEAKARSIAPMWKGPAFSFGTNVARQEILIVIGLVVVLALLGFFFTRPIGTALLATSQEPFAARIAGLDTRRMSMLTWGMAALFGAIAGMLFAPIDAFTPGFMTSRRLIPGFTAAVLGGITSIPGAVAGGFVVGLVESFFGYLFPEIAGADLLGVFIALMVVLFIRPQGLLGKEA